MAKNLGLVIYENVQPMDVIGPWEVLAIWKKVLDAPIDMYLVSEKGGLVKCDDDIILSAHCTFDDCPDLDYLRSITNVSLPSSRQRPRQPTRSSLSAPECFFCTRQAY